MNIVLGEVYVGGLWEIEIEGIMGFGCCVVVVFKVIFNGEVWFVGFILFEGMVREVLVKVIVVVCGYVGVFCGSDEIFVVFVYVLEEEVFIYVLVILVL